jgi:SAM-dependent methyltransferase
MGISTKQQSASGDISGRSETTKHNDGCPYETIDYWNIRKVLRALKPSATDVFYDIGSGMGRVICVAARLRMKKCVGIELSGWLCETARRNAMRLRGRRSTIEVICGDAATTPLADGTIYFLFNPFGPETLFDTLTNIKNSLMVNPRTIRIVYYNATHARIFEESGYLNKLHEFITLGGLAVTFWINQ